MSNKLFANWEPIAEALRDVRNDGTSTDWTLVGYNSTKMETLQLVASGCGGTDEMKQHLSSDQALYGFVRVSERIDESDTIKFCFIKWVGTDLRPMSRAKLTPQVGEITAKFKPYHVDLYCTELEEVSQEVVEALVGKASMAKSAVISNDQARRIAEENEKKRRVVDERLNTPLHQSSSTTASGIVLTYSNSSSNSSSSSGAPSLTADQQETLQRLEGFKNSGILTEEEFEAKKRQVLGSSSTSSPTTTPTTPSATTNRSSKPSTPSVSSTPSSSAANSGSAKSDIEAAMKRATLVRFPDSDAIIDAIQQVRSDSTDADWMLTGYTDLKQTKDMHIGLVGVGSGGIEELKQHLTNDNIYYGLVRMTDQIDNSVTVKFVFIHFMGNELKPMARARVTTHKLTVSEVFRPYHVDTFASSASELSQQVLEDLVGATSFTKSAVIDNDVAKKIMEENETKRRAVEDRHIVM